MRRTATTLLLLLTTLWVSAQSKQTYCLTLRKGKPQLTSIYVQKHTGEIVIMLLLMD